ncbi:remorin [Selaginella moellendorffii]|uniref:remorin n=1 Tax=Selaginella moellendorffii TaxID=88036 RepID=UPI000D1C5CD4|nr:remorin [Selaginella moellendorffii]|eukprot:XP_002969762.2 remorin [Selaginella moellendorffii]
MTEQAPPAPVTHAPVAPVTHAPVDKNVTAETASPTSVIGTNVKSPPSPGHAPADANHAHAATTHPDSALAKVQHERTMSNIKAWEESRKAKATNRCAAVIAKIGAWEASQKAGAEAKLKQAEEKLEKKRAALVEKMRNQIAAAHKMAEERRALAHAQEGEEMFKIEETSAKYRAQNKKPGGFLCFKA